jgi:cytochrome P450
VTEATEGLRHPVEGYHYRTRDSVGDPWAGYAEWRERCPVVHTPAAGGYWLLARYEDIVGAACDPETFSSEGGVTVPRKPAPAPLIPFEIDPPRQVKLRALVMRHFTTRALRGFSDVADELCERLARPLRSMDTTELMADYVLPLSCLLFAEHVGVPRELHERTVAWLAPWVQPPFDAAALGQGLTSYDEMLADVAAGGHARPGSFLDEIEGASVDGVRLSEEERHGLRFTLLLAGVETTLYALGNALVLLDAEPAVRQALLADEGLIPAFVEEALRLVGPAEGHTRTLTRDVELHGQQLRAGEHVLLTWSAGSRDPRRFPAGDEIDLEQASTHHLAFGIGPHRCAGAPLARIEMRAALRSLLRAVPDFALETAQIDWYPNARGPMRLPARSGRG